uniref:HTH_38 domain-containing protein n=1 Tax=Heterorhabditis bacteriophora TaxID=37862 RepID=A0A1I7WJ05_HETBA
MSKGKNITPNQRVMIKVLLEQNLNPVQIAKKLNLSRCAIQNAIKHINKFEMLENASRAPKKRKAPCFFEELESPMARQKRSNIKELEAIVKKA